MHELSEQENAYPLDRLFARLTSQDVEQFSAVYQQWMLSQRVQDARGRIERLQQQIAENEEQMRQVHPSPLALATLARLQANGVQDIELLDAMLERGESWLDQTMQRLDYCEQLDDFLSEDYTQWCQRALEGAYDWIDSLREAATTAPSDSLQEMETAQTGSPGMETTEEILLQKLTSEDDLDREEETLKQTAVRLPTGNEAARVPENNAPSQEETSAGDVPASSAEQAVVEEGAGEEERTVPASDAIPPGIQQQPASEPVYTETSTARAPDAFQHEESAAESYPLPEALPSLDNAQGGEEKEEGEPQQFIEFAPEQPLAESVETGAVNEEEGSFIEFSYWEEQEVPGEDAPAVEYIASDDSSPFGQPEPPASPTAMEAELYEFVSDEPEEPGAPSENQPSTDEPVVPGIAAGNHPPMDEENSEQAAGALWQVDTKEQVIVDAAQAQPAEPAPPVESSDAEEARMITVEQDTAIQPAAPSSQEAPPQPTRETPTPAPRTKKPGFFRRLFGLR